MAGEESTSGSELDSSDSESLDTDEELQRSFAEKSLKPGLHVLTPFVKKRTGINNVNGLLKKLNDFKLDLVWLERLDTISDLAPVAPELTPYLGTNENDKEALAQDDFKRELLFYRQAQSAVMEAIPKLRGLGIPTKRPDDYFAQMAKSDEHMQKVRETLISKQVIIERREKVRKIRELRKYGKQVQQDTIQKRNKEKKELLESVKKYRKGQKNNLDFLDDSKGKQHLSSSKNKKALRNRKLKDKRFGFGGQKKRSKYNDASSSAEVVNFNNKIHQPKMSRKRNANVGGQKRGKSGRQKGSKRK